MNEISHPIPSKIALMKASAIAFGISVIALVFMILPAEYNIDITGFGGKIGLVQLAATDSPETAAMESIVTGNNENQIDNVTIEIPAGKGIEYKFYLTQYAKLEYQWVVTNGERIYFDFHGEPEGDTTGYFESYTIAVSEEMKGSMIAPFAGSHGWYWRNDSLTPVKIMLTTKGDYQVIGNPRH